MAIRLATHCQNVGRSTRLAASVAKQCGAGSRVVKKGCRFGKLLPLQTRRKTLRDYSWKGWQYSVNAGWQWQWTIFAFLGYFGDSPIGSEGKMKFQKKYYNYFTFLSKEGECHRWMLKVNTICWKKNTKSQYYNMLSGRILLERRENDFLYERL